MNNSDFKVLENVITDDEIQILLDHWNSIECDIFSNVNKWDNSSKTKTKIDSSTRLVEIVGIQKGTFPFLSKILEDCFSQVIEDFKMEYPHYFTYYPLGGKHTKHTDGISGFNREWVITLYLNDNFEGGELVIGNEVSPIKKGSAVLYNGNTLHEVRPVTKGERFVITECAGKN